MLIGYSVVTRVLIGRIVIVSLIGSQRPVWPHPPPPRHPLRSRLSCQVSHRPVSRSGEGEGQPAEDPRALRHRLTHQETGLRHARQPGRRRPRGR